MGCLQPITATSLAHEFSPEVNWYVIVLAELNDTNVPVIVLSLLNSSDRKSIRAMIQINVNQTGMFRDSDIF